ncbi:hypothetical protein B0H10DRAFT_1948807 [Mycena sp. CBHHK59/15]|nr:hypothetical protein B0H10DRAFT_1948807 [Mycena sp. CBHHK59/15]
MAPWTLSFVFGLPRHHPHTRTEVNCAWARGSGDGQGEQDSHEPAGGVANPRKYTRLKGNLQERTDAGHWIPGGVRAEKPVVHQITGFRLSIIWACMGNIGIESGLEFENSLRLDSDYPKQMRNICRETIELEIPNPPRVPLDTVLRVKEKLDSPKRTADGGVSIVTLESVLQFKHYFLCVPSLVSHPVFLKVLQQCQAGAKQRSRRTAGEVHFPEDLVMYLSVQALRVFAYGVHQALGGLQSRLGQYPMVLFKMFVRGPDLNPWTRLIDLSDRKSAQIYDVDHSAIEPCDPQGSHATSSFLSSSSPDRDHLPNT